MSESSPVLSVAEFEQHADAVLTPRVRDYIAGGSGRETALAANRSALDDVSVVPRVLRDLTDVDLSCELVGNTATLPVALAPLAYQCLAHPDGEVATARAAAGAGVPITVSTLSSRPVEDITGTGATTWFQLYWLRDRRRRVELVRRAEDAGCTALVVTVDVPWMGRRLRDVRNAFALPPGVSAAHLDTKTADTAGRSRAGSSAVATHTALTFDPSPTWSDLAALRETTRLPLVVKGILSPADAVRAVECGAEAVVVSNHGGRQLDVAPPSAWALGPVRAAVGDRCQVLMDSGVRGGADVLRAVALGADGVLIGRPVLWALALDGEHGVAHLLTLLSEETSDAFGLAGCTRVHHARALRTMGPR